MRKSWLACTVALVGATGCPSVTENPNDTVGKLPSLDGPTVDFDPTNSIVPFPNDLATANGKVNLPAQCNESPLQTAIRTTILNTLDGFGTYETSLTATFSAAPDMASLGSNDVVLYERLSRGSAVDPASATAIPATLLLTQTEQYNDGCTGSATLTDELVVIPNVPLDENSTYDVAILTGATSAGSAFLPSFTWALVRQPDDPVTFDDQGNVLTNFTPINPADGSAAIAELQGIDELWNAFNNADGSGNGPLPFLVKTPSLTGMDYTDVLVAWEFTTQTTTDPLDATIANTPAANALDGALSLTTSLLTGQGAVDGCAGVGLTAPCTAEAFLNAALTSGGVSACQPSAAFPNNVGYLPCDAVGDVVAGIIQTNNYQVGLPNPLTGGADIPGAWSDPYNPVVQNKANLQFIGFVPAATCGSGGCPTIVFGHGLGADSQSLIAIAPTFASAGFISIAIDMVDSGSRAVQISDDPNLACAATGSGSAVAGQPVALSPTANHQCFASILSTNLDQTRDNFRQSILDVQAEISAAKKCGPTSCVVLDRQVPLSIDPAHVVYAGISLGGILGTAISASSVNISTALLNVPGVGWLDVLENTLDAADIACPLVDALITDGVLVGEPSGTTYDADGTATVGNGSALCLQIDPATNIYAWREQPGYQQFGAIARWVLDPGDPANFMTFFAGKTVLEEEVLGDHVVSNVAGTHEGELLGVQPGSAAVDTGSGEPTAAVATATSTTWIQYSNIAPAGAFPGNTYQHAALEEPAPSGSDALPVVTVTGAGAVEAGVLGTVQLQVDGVTFLFNNK